MTRNQSSLGYVVNVTLLGNLLIYVVFIQECGSPENPTKSSKTRQWIWQVNDISLPILPKQSHNNTCDGLIVNIRAACFNISDNYMRSIVIKLVTGGRYIVVLLWRGRGLHRFVCRRTYSFTLLCRRRCSWFNIFESLLSCFQRFSNVSSLCH